jgi:hypothetical protein
MNYPTYLIHFNPYHDPKTGQFARATGDFKGVRMSLDRRRQKNAVKEGVVTKEGYVTKKAEDRLNTFLKYKEKVNKTQDEVKKLFDKSEDLMDDFGGPDQIDDWDFFELIAESDPNLSAADLKAFKNSRVDEDNFYIENRSRIKEAMNMLDKYFPYTASEIMKS